MRAAIYNPYLDTLGGGERYTMAVAKLLEKKGYRVVVQWKDSQIKNKLENRFGIKLGDIAFRKSINRGDGFDVCFWVSDGSIPLFKARNNILHFQIPFKDINGKTLVNRMKMFRINHIVCNSKFTKKHIDNSYGVKSTVIYPPVDINRFKARKKENLIISIGRFSQLTQAKRQDVLVRAFKKYYDLGNQSWKFVLAGGTDVGVDDYINKLQKTIDGYPIKIIRSPSFKTLIDIYGKAKIFWSASGFGIDEDKEPKKVEHFGITVVEAMSAGLIPLVYNAGGHKEIVKEGVNGYLWKSRDSLVNKTRKLISDPKLLKKLSLKGRKEAPKFSYERFEKEIQDIL